MNKAGAFLRSINIRRAESMPPMVAKIRFRKVKRGQAVTPTYESAKAAGFDLTTAEHVVLQPGTVALVTTGLVIACPPGHMLYLTFRSSTPKRYGVMVLEGILDEDYCGDDDHVKLQLWNFTDKPQTIPLGTRIAQGIFVPVTRGEFVEVDKMGESRGGFGSTG